MREIIRRLGPVTPLAVIAGTLPALGGFLLLGTLTWSGSWLRDLGQGGGFPHAGLLLYVALYTFCGGLALLPTYAQSVLGGWAFGRLWGSLGAVTGVVLAASLASAIARRASGDRLVGILEEHPRWRAVYQALLGGGFWKTLGIVILLRLPPNSPFAITNLALSAMKVPWRVYVPGTLLGIAPRTILVACIGAELSDLDFTQPRRGWLVIASIISAIVVVAIIGTLANRAIDQVTRPKQPPASP